MLSDKKVLIADDDPDLVSVLAIRCRELGLTVEVAQNGVTAILKARKNPPHLMVVDIGMPEADGFRVCDRLQELDLVFPVIVLTGRGDDETRRRCAAMGAHFVLKGSQMWDDFEPLLIRLLNIRRPVPAMPTDEPGQEEEVVTLPETAPRVLAVDDDPGITRSIKVRLRQYGIETIEASNGLDGFEAALKYMPDLIISDYTMPEGSGEHLLIRLKQAERTRSIPIIVLTGQTFSGGTDVALRRDLLGRRGASAYLAKPIDFDDLLGEIRKHVVVGAVGDKAIAAVGR